MPRPKRTIEELANKSDSDDENYSDRPVRSSRHSARSKSRKKPKPTKKRTRRHSDDDITSDDDDILDDADELDFDDEDEEDPNAPKNARGLTARRAATNRPVYNEGDSSSVDDDFGEPDDSEPTRSPKKRKSTVVTLKVNALKRQPLPESGRRMTRRTRDPSEDIVALTNSGRHMELVERGTHSPEMEARRSRRGSRASKRLNFGPEKVEIDEKPEVFEPIEETSMEVKASQPEIMESNHQGDFEEGVPSGQDSGEGAAEGDEVGVVPESENGDVKHQEEDDEDDEGPTTRRRRSKPSRSQPTEEAQPDEEEGAHPRRSGRKKPRSSQRKRQDDESDFEPEEDESNDDDDEELSQSGKSHGSPRKASQARDDEEQDSTAGRRPGLRKRASRSRGQSEVRGDIAEELAEELEDLRGDRPRRRLQTDIVYEKPRRSRKDVDYRIIRPDLILPIEEAENEVNESPSRRGRGGGGSSWQRTLFPTYGPFGGGGPPAILAPPGAPAATGGVDSDSSDDEVMQHPKGAATGGSVSGPPGAGLLPSAQTHGADPLQGPSGTPANLGKIKDKQALADADPLGVDVNVNFDSVGGLQGHIDQLKEMVSLPLLYPEIFQRFHIVPPRGVLFHGPPGTGKTLLARALANSVSSEGRKVTFYMRKGADALSKWVGEAERQLRLLFEEARKTQPSIIFFDEIDGLAPVRSSKQEQIHASIVSTLLALMDGMDGRGQVIVIGATNRPDSIDPALRRPGRFDREFYFPLPNTEGRRAILDIHTKGWDPPLPDHIKDELAEITKGYGGADLRALCTEAALNAVQRRYPQIYKSDQKLLIDPKKIDVTPKDFMLAIKKIVPSSERSASSGATPLPKVVEPLLRRPLSDIKTILSEILPQRKRLTALEEAQFEEPEGPKGFRREQMQQEFDTSRVYRPRMLVRGPFGMGQQHLAGALLHHFEGLHVQAFDLPTLLSDSTRSPEAAVIQLFQEVKRHKPSVIYIPNLQSWLNTVGPTVISTLLGLLRSVPPSDPVLLFGVLESTGEEVDNGLLGNMFGFSKKNFYDLKAPDYDARYEFFGRVIDYVKTSPSEFPDPEKRKRRELETLEVAPPPPPKPAPPPTKEQLKAQKKKDHQTLNLLKIRIQPIMDQIKKYKRFRTGVIDESQIRYLWEEDDPNIVTSDLPIEQRTTFRPFEKAFDKHGVPGLRETVSGKFFYNMEIVTIEKRLSNGYYKRPKDFLADIKRLAKDARQLGDQERLLRANELLSNVEVDIATIEQAEPALVAECENVYLRELEREKLAAEQAKKAAGEGGYSRLPATGNVPHGNTDSGPSSGPVVLGESFPDGQARPQTPTRRSAVSFLTNGYHEGGGSDLNDLSNHATISNGSPESRGDGDGDVYMTNSEDHSGERETQGSSFGPSAQPRPPYSHTAPSQQVRRESGFSSLSQKGPMTPMAPGSQPNDYTNEASTTQTTSDKKSSEQSSVPQNLTQSPMAAHGLRHDFPDLTQYPDRVSQEEHLPDTQQPESSQPSPHPRESLPGHADFAAGESQSQPKHQPPVPLFEAPVKQSSHVPTALQSLLNNEDLSPKVSLEHELIDNLHNQLTQRTSGCSVEQLEQINSNLMDYIWRMRGEWNRNKVAAGIRDTFNVVLEDMQAMQEIGPISQRTKEQLGADIFHA
ncbi:chromatin segregase YTA7 [Aspergillus fischeri NRRL 181]|uniref:AAA family ATPase, putative n=1 Tax=Neosartorya fischeri (strain ATCC 1020 / DSM 3700 / CBS 544.65 / FGSC A1164 / JCM 1740 / NRRL 181 / WB 181) TaxID=331117 RepID=A1DB38_NEOFI|nr:AAA family ATPase, putative [Aspergillus fischeri NRRL 181]EAW20078.1 AAA family ATPase, putative [Aspergillus fischeri NRRL 181]